MTKSTLFRRNTIVFIFIVLSAFAIVLQSCKKKVRSDIAKVLFAETKNKAFKNLDADTFAVVFQKLINDRKSNLSNPKLISSYYESKDYEPTFVLQHIPKGELKVLPEYLSKSEEHGLDSKIFNAEGIRQMVDKIYDPKGIKNQQDA